jgi:hypothetical protein
LSESGASSCSSSSWTTKWSGQYDCTSRTKRQR